MSAYYNNEILFRDKNTKHNGNSTYNPSKYILDCSEHYCNKFTVRFSNEERVNSSHDGKLSMFSDISADF